MNNSVTIRFEEIPMIREPNMVAGLVSGEAEITVYDEGEWFISAIILDGKRDGDSKPYCTPVAELDRGSWLDRTIAAELESGWKKVIEDRVQDFIGEYV